MPGVLSAVAMAGAFPLSAVWWQPVVAGSRVLLECGGCGCQTSVTAGTIFQDTRTPLPVWFRTMWWVTTQKNGASALGLQRILSLKKYETAWTMLHKLRRAMVRPGRDLLTGRIEVDEGYVGGVEEGLPGRLNLKKALVVVAAQEDGPGIGRIRMRQVIDASADSLILFIRDSVQPGSIVHTDGWSGYWSLESDGYAHEVTILKRKKRTPSELLPRVHRVISLLKRWLLGTNQGAVSQKHLDYYLDEFTFRFNRRRSKSRGTLLSSRPASCRRGSRTLRPHRPPDSPQGQTTICWGNLSEADTHLGQL